MAAAAPVRVAPPDSAASFLRLCGLLRDIRAYAQDLQRSLDEVHQKASLTDAQTRAREIQIAEVACSQVLQRERVEVEARLGQIRSLFQEDATQYDWCGDEVANVENYWQRALEAWPRADMAPEVVLQAAGKTDECLDQVVYHCASLTITPRLDDMMGNLRVGQPLDFHNAFEDELPKRDQRVRVLQDLAAQPGVVGGVIDVPQGLVYRASPSAGRRRLSVVLIAAAALAGFPVVWVLSQVSVWLQLKDWPIAASTFPTLCVGYLFVLIGSAAHLVVDALKQSRSGKSQGFIALEDWLLWLHVREGSLLWAILYLWVGFGFVAWSLAVSQKEMGWQTGFFTGYSIDSVVDLFLDRFQKSAGERTAQLKQQVA
jgi:hypothetical protein